MRTTVTIDDSLLAAAKRRAAERGQTVGQVLEAALRRELARTETAAPPPLAVVTRGTATAPGIDWSSNRAVREFADEDVPPELLR